MRCIESDFGLLFDAKKIRCRKYIFCSRLPRVPLAFSLCGVKWLPID